MLQHLPQPQRIARELHLFRHGPRGEPFARVLSLEQRDGR
jgi:hypothetical protein